MRILYKALNIMLWSFIGVFIGSSLFRFIDFKTHPDLYAVQSAPWYLSIQLDAVFTAMAAAILLLAMWAVKKRMK